MWVWIASSLAAWLGLSALGALAVGRFLFVSEREEQLVEMQREQRDPANPPVAS
ncbi:hypothetical protein [Rhodococcus sp. 852002-51564_SCH6189132-a]|uniref:hypothetical protein n=1 Tax=Rhodococcus sp. 852002-51564_SCH6189132-a TaxID=1834103 RepID=UPI0018D2CB66|nr:hypothetical protein [Rhodococcus sp. 852002-51564_SCH6189132-a]